MVACWLALGAPAAAAVSREDAAADAVRATLAEVQALNVAGRSQEEAAEAVRRMARRLVDTRDMGRRAAAPKFAEWSGAQQTEFLDLFDELFVRSYLQKLLLFRGPTFRVDRAAAAGDHVMVDTTIVTAHDSYEVSYDMHLVDGQWLATDVIVEGVGMTSSYADQFASILRDRSVDDLLALLRRKVDHFRGLDRQRGS
jgi:phospholipid transport system substrate-binding protein